MDAGADVSKESQDVGLDWVRCDLAVGQFAYLRRQRGPEQCWSGVQRMWRAECTDGAQEQHRRTALRLAEWTGRAVVRTAVDRGLALPCRAGLVRLGRQLEARLVSTLWSTLPHVAQGRSRCLRTDRVVETGLTTSQLAAHTRILLQMFFHTFLFSISDDSRLGRGVLSVSTPGTWSGCQMKPN